MHVLLIVNQFPPDVNTSGKLMHALARELTRRGHRVTVITTFPHYRNFRIEAAYRGRFFESVDEDGVRVIRTWLWASGNKNNMWHRLGSYLSGNLLAALSAQLTDDEFDIILCPNGSFFTGMVGWLIGVLRGIPFIYNVQDIYPDVPVRAGQLNNRLLINGLEMIEQFMYSQAARITVIANAQRSILMRKGVAAGKITVIPNFVDTSRLQPGPRDNAYRREQQWGDSFVAMHSGNIGFAYDFDSLLDAAQLLQHRPDIRIVITGDGVRKAELLERARTLANVEFLPFQPEDRLAELRAASDVQLSLYRTGSADLSLPSKIYEILASGRPLIASADPGSDVQTIIDETSCGIFIPAHDATALAHAITRLCDDRNSAHHMAVAGRIAAEQRYSLRHSADEYESLLQNTAGNIDLR